MSQATTDSFRPARSEPARATNHLRRLSWRQRVFKWWLYRNHRAFGLLLNRLRRRITLAGWLAMVTAIVVGAVGADTNASNGYETFALLASAIIGSALCAPFGRPRLNVER